MSQNLRTFKKKKSLGLKFLFFFLRVIKSITKSNTCVLHLKHSISGIIYFWSEPEVENITKERTRSLLIKIFDKNYFPLV